MTSRSRAVTPSRYGIGITVMLLFEKVVPEPAAVFLTFVVNVWLPALRPVT